MDLKKNYTPLPKPPVVPQGKLAYWITVHKIELRRGGIFSLALMGGVLMVYGVVGLINYYGFELSRARDAERDLVRPSIPPEVLASQAPKPLQVGAVQVISGSGDKVDALVSITNPNPRMVVNFSYAFTVAGKGDTRTTHLLPGETRPVIGLGISGGSARNVNFAIVDLHWRRIRPQEAQDVKAYLASRLAFRVVREAYHASLPLPSTQVGRVVANIANDSAYGFYRANFIITLARAGRIIGVTEVAVDQFATGVERTLEATWIPSPGAADKVEFYPIVNVFDPSVFLPPS